MKVIDLTHTIKENMPVYPGDDTPKLIPVSTYEKDGFKETLLQMYSHTGTHMDTPAHIFAGRTALDEFPIEQFIGRALVIDCRDLEEAQVISMECINKVLDRAKKADFLLFNLGWDKRWGTDSYFGDYPCINDEVLDFIINGDYKGIGFDVMGLDPMIEIGRASCRERV